MHWNHVTNGVRGSEFLEFLQQVKALQNNQLWRHNVSGDLEGTNEVIDSKKLKALTIANKRKKGFTYTHYPMNTENNRQAVKFANDNGFTVNLSANNTIEADHLKSLNIGPVVSIMPKDASKVTITPNGNKIVICPAMNSDKITCANCGLCQLQNRDYIIGFRVHGTYAKKQVLQSICKNKN